MNFYKILSTFVGHFCPPGSGSGYGFRLLIRIHRPDWIRIQYGSGSRIRIHNPTINALVTFKYLSLWENCAWWLLGHVIIAFSLRHLFLFKNFGQYTGTLSKLVSSLLSSISLSETFSSFQKFRPIYSIQHCCQAKYRYRVILHCS